MLWSRAACLQAREMRNEAPPFLPARMEQAPRARIMARSYGATDSSAARLLPFEKQTAPADHQQGASCRTAKGREKTVPVAIVPSHSKRKMIFSAMRLLICETCAFLRLGRGGHWSCSAIISADVPLIALGRDQPEIGRVRFALACPHPTVLENCERGASISHGDGKRVACPRSFCRPDFCPYRNARPRYEIRPDTFRN